MVVGEDLDAEGGLGEQARQGDQDALGGRGDLDWDIPGALGVPDEHDLVERV